MRKWLFGVVALLAIAGMASAAESFTMSAPDSVAPGAQFTLTITMTVTDTNVAGWGLDALTGPTGMFTVEAYNSANVPRLFANTLGFAITAADTNNPWTGSPALTPGGTNVGIFSNVPNFGAATPGTSTVLTLLVTAGPTPATGQIGATRLYYGTTDFDELSIAGVHTGSITITPEPISALLLLAGLPMLRRRR
jgi:hypothetical protein